MNAALNRHLAALPGLRLRDCGDFRLEELQAVADTVRAFASAAPPPAWPANVISLRLWVNHYGAPQNSRGAGIPTSPQRPGLSNDHAAWSDASFLYTALVQ